MSKNLSSSMGVNIIGYFNGSFGLGESARLLAESMKKTDIPFALISADSLAEHHHRETFAEEFKDEIVYPVNLFCIDPRHFFSFFVRYGWEAFKDRYNIALCFWETNIVPRSHRTPWSHLDEIWAPTRYVQEHLSIATEVPVHHISQPVRLSYQPSRSSLEEKKSFGLQDKFTFLFCFCFYSVLGRKNPMAVIDAFKKAFKGRDDVQLVIKSQNGSQYPNRLNHMLEATKEDGRIVWMDQSLSSQRRYDLMHACDCYVSLHRSEGFGLTMAEAMLLNKPVIATGYSGNLDFMTEENSFLCPYQLVPIGKGNPPYSAKGIWAEVDIDQAAHLMKHIVENRSEAARVAERGKAFVLKHLSFDAVGEQIARRLARIPLVENRGKSAPLHYQYAMVRKKMGDMLPFLRPAVRYAKKNVKEIIRKFR